MFLADSHTHSNCSPDGTVPMVAMAQGAIAAGVSCLCITDHCDFLSLDGTQRTPFYNWSPVLAQFEEMQRQYGTSLDLRLGLEFGMGHLDPEGAKKVLSQPGLDFVIGAVHNLREELGGKDFYFLDYETEGDCYRALDDYFASMVELSKGAFYDVIGHIIYPLRYMRGQYETPISLSRYTDSIRLVMKHAVQSGRGIEINTWKGQTLKEWIPMLKLYRECGGEIVTVGSDAHAPGPIGAGIRESYTMLSDLGFSYVTVFKERKAEFVKLP